MPEGKSSHFVSRYRPLPLNRQLIPSNITTAGNTALGYSKDVRFSLLVGGQAFTAKYVAFHVLFGAFLALMLIPPTLGQHQAYLLVSSGNVRETLLSEGWRNKRASSK
jgi:hypothetical protein